MTLKPDPKAVSETELLGLLRRVGEEPVNEAHGDEQDAQEARLAARLDAQIAQLSQEHRRSRRSRALLVSLAAALPLGFLAARATQRPGSALALDREPVPSVRQPAAPPSSVPSAPEARAATQLIPPRSAERGLPSAVTSAALADAGGASDSTLGTEIGLFQGAVNAAHAGNVDQALRGFEQLLQNYPHSPLAQTALVRKFRVLSSAGKHTEARAEARRYLQMYPAGFGQREAEVVANGQTSQNATDGGDDTDTR